MNYDDDPDIQAYLAQQRIIIGNLLDQVFCTQEEKTIVSDIDVSDSMLEGVVPTSVLIAKSFFSPSCEVSIASGTITAIDNDGKVACAPVARIQDYFSPMSSVHHHSPSVLPSPRNQEVTGQSKLVVDIMLSIPNLKKTDHVIVVGGYSQCRGGGAYSLLAGNVATVDCYDPYYPSDFSEAVIVDNHTTYYRYFSQKWPPGVTAVCDAFFNDAYDSNDDCCVHIPTTARVFSIKRFGDDVCVNGGEPYYQIRKTRTNEWREVLPPRRPGKCNNIFGTCLPCREMAYFLQSCKKNLLSRFSMLHDPNRECTLRIISRRPDVRYGLPTIGAVTVKPVYQLTNPSNYGLMAFSPDLNSKGRDKNLLEARGVIPPGQLKHFMNTYLDFFIREDGSPNAFTTDPGGPPEIKLGLSATISPDREIVDLVKIPIGVVDKVAFVTCDVIFLGDSCYEFDVKSKSEEENLISQTAMIDFNGQKFPRNVQAINLSNGNSFFKKFRSWSELDKFVWFRVKGLS